MRDLWLKPFDVLRPATVGHKPKQISSGLEEMIKKSEAILQEQ